MFHFSLTDVEHIVLHPDHPTRHIHRKANSIGSGHATEDHADLQAVADSIADAGEVLITGPANAKTELSSTSMKHSPQLTSVLAGVETVDHPSDAQFVAYAPKCFRAARRKHRRTDCAFRSLLKRFSRRHCRPDPPIPMGAGFLSKTWK